MDEIKLTKIYALSSSEFPNMYRYIGKTNGTLKNRLKQHMSEAFRAKSDVKTYKINWLKSERAKNNSIIITLIDEVAKDNWEEAEKYYIKYFKSRGARLTNSTEGGQPGYPEKIPSFIKKEMVIKERVIIKKRIKKGRKRKPKDSYKRKIFDKNNIKFHIDEKTGKKILITDGFLARQKAKLEKQVCQN